MSHSNRLREAKSPYLLQHATNPVHWQPWDEEALTQALTEDRPIFLSIGYSTCHWCHVMAHESFENEQTAALLNEHFVPIKVDREERPDLDYVYMTAVQLLTGSGGWPLSVFLLPEGLPFAGGTYYTPGRFRKLLENLATGYRRQRVELEGLAEQLGGAVAETFLSPSPRERAALSQELVDDALAMVEYSFDAVHGGFGGAPKFPPYNTLSLLLHVLAREENAARREMLTRTLEAMALGGLRDHIGGGFHRYATDVNWRIPHFEKMLYDNALLAQVYVGAYAQTHDPLYRQVAEETYTWVEREMTIPEGGFCAGLDADSEGVEGKYYLWTKEEVLDALGEEGEQFCEVYHVEEQGNYREEHTGMPTGRNILYLTARLHELAPQLEVDPEAFLAHMAGARERLRQVRERRIPPHRDDKVLASWNGLMIGSLARAGRELGVTKYAAMAEKAAGFLREHLWQEGRLMRSWRDGPGQVEGFLDDYANLANGLIELHEATQERAWLDWAKTLMERALAEFWDDGEADFRYTAASGEALFVRPKEHYDHPLPASSAMAALALHRLAMYAGEARYGEVAAEALRALTPRLEEHPHGTESTALAIAMVVEGTAEPYAEAA